ncbi:MAG: hypothetical protein ACLSA6_11040 [Holdemania massiliensis]
MLSGFDDPGIRLRISRNTGTAITSNAIADGTYAGEGNGAAELSGSKSRSRTIRSQDLITKNDETAGIDKAMDTLTEGFSNQQRWIRMPFQGDCDIQRLPRG